MRQQALFATPPVAPAPVVVQPRSMSKSTSLLDCRLIHGDCLEVMPTLEDKSVAMCFADLPYAVAGNRYTDCPWDVPFDLDRFFASLCLLLKSDAVLVMTSSARFMGKLLGACPIRFRYDLVWHKTRATGHLNAKKMPLRAHELVLVFYARLPCYSPVMRPNNTGRQGSFVRAPHKKTTVYTQKRNQQLHALGAPLYPTSVFSIDAPHRERGLHPTQKPVALLEYILKTYTRPGDLVLDPTAGSGGLVIAALNTGRRCIAIEKDPSYFEVMSKRVAEHKAKLMAQA